MKMKLMQVMLVVAAILAAIGIAVGLSRDEIQDAEEYAKEYQPSGLMKFFGSLVGPPMLSPDELTDAGRAFPSSLRLTSNSEKTFQIAPDAADQRRASFRITGQSLPLTVTYDVPEDQRFNDRRQNNREWKQRTAENRNKVSFVIFSKGGELIFKNKGSNSSTVTIRIEE